MGMHTYTMQVKTRRAADLSMGRDICSDGPCPCAVYKPAAQGRVSDTVGKHRQPPPEASAASCDPQTPCAPGSSQQSECNGQVRY